MTDSIPNKVLDAVMMDKNVVILGEGGTGKSTLIEEIMLLFGDETVIAAPTGLAAINVEGQTAHSLFRMPMGVPNEDDITGADKLRKVFGVRSPTRRIVFDEVGMMNSAQMWYMDQQLQVLRKNEKPFGGLQVILVGDFLQLGTIVRKEEKRMYWDQHGFPEIFMYKEWDKFNFEVFNLEVVHRQADPVFKAVLGRVRMAEQTQADLDYLNQRVTRKAPKDVTTTCLTNGKCASINDFNYAQLKGEEFVFEGYAINFKERPVPETIKLKIGAKVLICANKSEKVAGEDDRIIHVNGDMGIVTKITPIGIVVDTERAGPVKVGVYEYIKYELKKVGKKWKRNEVGSYNQLPVKLAYGMTTHKMQGQTLDDMHLDLEWDSYKVYYDKRMQAQKDKDRDNFLQGIVYVGLSRVKTLEGLTLQRPILMTDIRVNPRAKTFMEQILEDIDEQR